MAAPTFSKMDHSCAAPVGLTDGSAQSLAGFRNGDPMNKVRHQAIGPNADSQTPAPFAHHIEISLMIPLGGKDGLAAVASPGAMMRKTGRHYPCESGHIRFL